MKKFLMFTLVLGFVLLYANKVDAYTITNTGHQDIIELEFSNNNYRLLNQYSTSEINPFYKKVPKAAFGWSAYTIKEGMRGKYISDIVLAKSNRTNQQITYRYTLKEGNETTKEVSTSGTIASKFSGKVKGVSAAVESSLKKEWTTKTKTYYEESTQFTVTIDPFKRVELRVTGDCNVSNGVGKYYVLGIAFKKGTWEYIDKVTEYYELYETSM